MRVDKPRENEEPPNVARRRTKALATKRFLLFLNNAFSHGRYKIPEGVNARIRKRFTQNAIVS